MHITNIHEAKTHLSRLIQQAMAGDDIVIAKAGEPLVRLTPVQNDMQPRQGGQWAGKFEFLADWDEADREIAIMLEPSAMSPDTE